MGFDVPPQFDVNDFKALLILVDNLRAAGVKTFTHPSGLSLTLDTQYRQPALIKPPVAEDEF